MSSPARPGELVAARLAEDLVGAGVADHAIVAAAGADGVAARLLDREAVSPGGAGQGPRVGGRGEDEHEQDQRREEVGESILEGGHITGDRQIGLRSYTWILGQDRTLAEVLVLRLRSVALSWHGRAIVVGLLFLGALGLGPASASAAGLIAAYDRYVTGSGFQIGLVNAATGAAIALPAGVNTPDDELHPTLSPDGRYLVFMRTKLLPKLNGDIVPPEARTLFIADRETGTVQSLSQTGAGPVFGPPRAAGVGHPAVSGAPAAGSLPRLAQRSDQRRPAGAAHARARQPADGWARRDGARRPRHAQRDRSDPLVSRSPSPPATSPTPSSTASPARC